MDIAHLADSERYFPFSGMNEKFTFYLKRNFLIEFFFFTLLTH